MSRWQKFSGICALYLCALQGRSAMQLLQPGDPEARIPRGAARRTRLSRCGLSHPHTQFFSKDRICFAVFRGGLESRASPKKILRRRHMVGFLFTHGGPPFPAGACSSQATFFCSTPSGRFTYVSLSKGFDVRKSLETSIALKFHFLCAVTDKAISYDL